MMDRILVTHEYTCPVCKGEGYHWDQNWVAANEAWDIAIAEARDKGAEQYAAVDAGAAALEKYWADLGYYDHKKYPPETYPCGECEGQGIIRKEIDLREALVKLGFTVEIDI